jgi:[acyl-carrier-protein] S-malonyltransferase
MPADPSTESQPAPRQVTAFLFPGQGSQYAGMGQDLADRFPEARARFEAADAQLGFGLSTLMFGAGAEAAEALKQTEVTQPALYVHSLAAMAVLERRGLLPDMVAGHSLGEYSALAAAGAISFEDGLRVVRLRGQLMAEAGERRPGTMGAVLGMDDAVLEDVCRTVTDAGAGLVQPANYNAPGQVVISGDLDAVSRALELASERGAQRVVPLSVSGAFHSPLMGHARDGLAEALERLPIQAPRCPVYLNVTPDPTTDPEEIRARLLEQLMSPVRWAQLLQNMHADGATLFVEVGAGRVLSGLARRTLGRQLGTAAFGKADELEVLAGLAA